MINSHSGRSASRAVFLQPLWRYPTGSRTLVGEVIFNLGQRSLPTIGILCLVDAFDDGAMYVILVDVERLNFTNDSDFFSSTS